MHNVTHVTEKSRTRVARPLSNLFIYHSPFSTQTLRLSTSTLSSPARERELILTTPSEFSSCVRLIRFVPRPTTDDVDETEKHPAVSDWIKESIDGGSLPHVDLTAGTNGWASPPGNLFSLRARNYFTDRLKSPSTDYLLVPAGVDWLKSTSKLDHILSRPDNRVMHALRKSHSRCLSLKSFVFAVNLQIPGRDHHSAVFYFAAENPIPSDSLLHKFINGNDAFRNNRFKIVNRIVKGPWIVKKAVGNYSACLLGRAVNISYHRGENYLEVDVDVGSSAIASAILHLALGYVTSVSIDMGFLVEAQEEEELPERLIGAVRVCQMQISSATVVEAKGE